MPRGILKAIGYRSARIYFCFVLKIVFKMAKWLFHG